MTSGSSKTTSLWRQAFLLALLIALLVFLPFIIYDGGYFIYYGDFNVQQIPFYQLAHSAVRSGDVLWNWYTDLGANFIGSYSFYLLFSPFFWLTIPFPTSALPLLMAPLLILKTACCALTSYLYIERFVKDRRYAVIGSLLYAFSGWMFFNIFFNHFHDVAVFFPLLLLSVELLVCENKKGVFAITVAISAMVNYWFFVGEVVFVIIYFIIRAGDKRWPITLGKFFRLLAEGIIGVGLVAVVLLPSVLALSGNPRTGTSELLTGWNFWLYWHEQRPPAILQSLFFPPDLPARPNFFPDHGAKWSSLSGWLPLFGMSGVFAYFFGQTNSWLKKILITSLVFALVPGLNSLFILLNNSYYARWFFMPILLMSLATVIALEQSRQTTAHFARSLRWNILIMAVFLVMSGLTPNFVDNKLQFGMAANPVMLGVYAIIVSVCFVIVALLVLKFRYNKRFVPLMGAGIALVSVVFGVYYLANGKSNHTHSDYVINTAIKGRDAIDIPMEPFARSDVYDSMDNVAMFWHLPNIQAFHSIVPPSIMEFYPTVGVKRDVGSRPSSEYYALRPLLSVRWLFIETKNEKQSPMVGYTMHSQQLGYNIYENDNYIPMGFGYSSYVSEGQMEEVAEKFRSNLFLRAILLEDDAIMRNQDILDYIEVPTQLDFTPQSMAEDAAARREQAAYSFEIDKHGFTALSNLDTETLLFFSVPYEAGFSATVNGQSALIEKANVGFMAVRVPAGEAVIRFDYFTPGLALGAKISGGFLAIFILYLILIRRRNKVIKEELDLQKKMFAGETINLSWEEYLENYRNKKERAAYLQRTINEANERHLPTTLEEGQRTINFKVPSQEDAQDKDEDKDEDKDNADI